MKAYWHLHHWLLLEFSDNIEERIRYINEEKPKDEIELRLKLLKEVKGNLPEEVIDKGIANYEVLIEYDNAMEEYKTLYNSYQKALYEKTSEPTNITSTKLCKMAERIRDKYRTILTKKEQAVDALNIYKEALEFHREDLEVIHRLECPNCPWNGKTIFSKEV